METLRGRGIEPCRVLEPTCGSGAFLQAAGAAFPAAQLIGIEFQRERYASALAALQREFPGLTVQFANAYAVDFARLAWRTGGSLLIVGNPPWVTAAALGRSPRGVLQPPRSNPKKLRGLAARTGAANFDVAEFLLLKLLRELRAERLHLALLVKESVARNVLSTAPAQDLGISWAEIVRIDARKWFGVAVDACCLLLSTGPAHGRAASVVIRPDFAQAPIGSFSVPTALQTPAPRVGFRQGVKHDAADVFELRLVDGRWRNGFGIAVDVEPEYVYPYLKARALHAGAIEDPMALVVPQSRLGADTNALEARAPRLWRYLCAHEARIAARKSSIYRNAPRFALFGIGPYSFAPWKVAVAGLYAQPRFRLIGPHSGRPVLLGDTSYFVPFESAVDAAAFADLCASPPVAAAFAQSVLAGKRPITKALLDGMDWPAFATWGRDPERLRALFHERVGP